MFDLLIRERNKPALFYGDRTATYTDILQHARLFANYYKSHTEGQVERVMLFSKNSIDLIFALYGVFHLKATAIPVDVMSTSKELGYMINDSRPQIIYCEEENRELVEGCVAKIQSEEGEYTPHIFTPEDLDTSGVGDLPAEAIMPGAADDIMTIIYTSGTTGSPKGVMLTYANLWYNVDAVTNFVNIFKPDGRVLLLLPLHHVLPFAGALLAPLYIGGQIYIVESLAPDVILNTLQKGRITVMIGVPRLYETFAKGIINKINASAVTRAIYKICSMIGSDSLSKKVFKSVQDKFGGHMEFFVSGGAALPLETGNIFKNLGLYVLEGYGMTECAPMISFTRPGERKVGYCGRMLPGCEYRIEESGELCVRGKNVMKGYYNREEETAATIRNGWLHTGDTALYDDRYGIQITGRIKEIIVTSNGKNINPAEIENQITQSSKIIKEIGVLLHEDILQAIVYPDLTAVRAESYKTMDELIREEIETYNRDAMGYKRILRYQISSQELPKTRLGKIQRFLLSQMMGEREQVKREDTSNKSQTFLALKEFLDDQTGNYANGDSHFEIDLALDSLGRVSLLAFIEERFGVSIEETALSEISTLNLLSAHLESQSTGELAPSEPTGDVSWEEILRASAEQVKLPKSGALHWFLHTKLWIIFSLIFRFRSQGHEKLPASPVIFVGNHRSALDGVLVTTPLKWRDVHNTFFFAKDSHFQSGFRRWMARRNNIILMNINSNVRESMQQMYQVLSRGHNIVIFPEGTRSKSGEMGKFKESFAILSQTLGVDVVPVAIKGAESVAYNSIRIPRLGNKIEVEFLPAMRSQEGETAAEFTLRVEEVIKSEVLREIDRV